MTVQSFLSQDPSRKQNCQQSSSPHFVDVEVEALVLEVKLLNIKIRSCPFVVVGAVHVQLTVQWERRTNETQDGVTSFIL